MTAKNVKKLHQMYKRIIYMLNIAKNPSKNIFKKKMYICETNSFTLEQYEILKSMFKQNNLVFFTDLKKQTSRLK